MRDEILVKKDVFFMMMTVVEFWTLKVFLQYLVCLYCFLIQYVVGYS